MRVMIFETCFSGHRLQYVRSILDALEPCAVSAMVVCGRGMAETREFATHLGPVNGSFQLDAAATTVGAGAPGRVAMRRFWDLQDALRRHRPDHVYIPYGDGLAQIAGCARALGWPMLRPGMEIEALLMRGSYAYETGPLSLRAQAAIRALEFAPFDVLHHLDPVVFDFLKRRYPKLAARLHLVPEAVESIEPVERCTARARLGIPTDGRYIGCLGALFAGKGVTLLIKAFLRSRLADARLLLVGAADPELRALLHGEFAAAVESTRIIHIDRYVSQSDFHLGLNASDVICVPHLNQTGSSGLVVRAAAAGRPILGSDFGWIGRVIQEFNLGVACNVENVATFAADIDRVLKRSDTHHVSAAAQQFTAFHNIQNFEVHWTRRLRERLHIHEERPLIGWDWPRPASVISDSPVAQDA